MLGNDPVTDGDTLRLAGGRAGARAFASSRVDAEEIWHTGEERDRAAAAADFDALRPTQAGRRDAPVKFGTPAGEAAKGLREGVLHAASATVRLERDELGRDFDGHGRLLAHVFFAKDGKDVLFAEALVRAGLSPYFVKYGRSRRFDARLGRAGRGRRPDGPDAASWATAVRHYPDYAERLVWWEARAKQVDAWRAEVRAAADPSTFVELGVASDSARLPSLLGRRSRSSERSSTSTRRGRPSASCSSTNPHRPFPIVIFDASSLGGHRPRTRRDLVRAGDGNAVRVPRPPAIKIDDPKAISTR